MLGACEEGDVAKAGGGGGGGEGGEDVFKHGGVGGNVGVFVGADLESNPEEVGDLVGDGREAVVGVFGVEGIERDVAVEERGREQWRSLASCCTQDLPWAAEGGGIFECLC